MAERTYSAAAVAERPIVEPVQFVETVREPLFRWSASCDTVIGLSRRYYEKDQSIASDLGTRLATFDLQVLESHKTGSALIEAARKSSKGDPDAIWITRRKVDVTSYLKDAEDYLYEDFDDDITHSSLTPEQKVARSQIVGEIQSARKRYGREFAQAFKQYTVLGDAAVEVATHYLSENYQHFEILCDYLQETDSEEATQILRLFANADREKVKKAVDKGRMSEEQSPSKELLGEFIKSEATKPQNGTIDPFWNGIYLMFPQSYDDIVQTIQGNNPEAIDSLLKPVIDAVTSKGLPPSLTMAYCLFIRRRANIYWASLIEKAEAVRISLDAFSREIYTKEEKSGDMWTRFNKRRETQRRLSEEAPTEPTEAEVTQKLETTETGETNGTKRVVLIGETACTNEQEIKDALKPLMIACKVKEYRPEDIDSYSYILSKLAGIRSNAPGYKHEKLNVDNVKFSTGEDAPVIEVRRTTPVAPRLAVTMSRDFLIVLKAWDRKDNSYHHQQRKFTFPEIQLPNNL